MAIVATWQRVAMATGDDSGLVTSAMIAAGISQLPPMDKGLDELSELLTNVYRCCPQILQLCHLALLVHGVDCRNIATSLAPRPVAFLEDITSVTGVGGECLIRRCSVSAVFSFQLVKLVRVVN
jgi:hypothetical protein